ncbi:MAG TPA: PRC-barrel domain-containing protein [Thermoleophilaceae bacterium]|jgi:sporulation protein YlmC with PRC-barrel domain
MAAEPDSDRGYRIAFEALERGTRVQTADGEELGTVKKVMIVHEKHLFDGIVVKTGSGDRFVDAPEVDEIFERLVTLKISAAEAAELPKPGANPAAMRLSAGDFRPGGARRLWNRLSGRR